MIELLYIGRGQIGLAKPHILVDGREGYNVTFPGGYLDWLPNGETTWMAKEYFEEYYRKITPEEINFLKKIGLCPIQR